MIESDFVANIVKDSIPMFWNNLFHFLVPIITPHIKDFILLGILMIIISRFTYIHSILAGYTHRQARRKAKKAVAAVEYVSTASDINDIMKK